MMQFNAVIDITIFIEGPKGEFNCIRQKRMLSIYAYTKFNQGTIFLDSSKIAGT